MYGTFTVIGIISNVIFCFLPTREVDNSISSIAKAADDEKGGKAAKIRKWNSHFYDTVTAKKELSS